MSEILLAEQFQKFKKQVKTQCENLHIQTDRNAQQSQLFHKENNTYSIIVEERRGTADTRMNEEEDNSFSSSSSWLRKERTRKRKEKKKLKRIYIILGCMRPSQWPIHASR